VKSMTGFGRADGQANGVTWLCEARSVNGRGLDLRLKLPSGWDSLEPTLRDMASKALSRGNVTVTVTAETRAQAPRIALNEAALAQVLAAAERVRAITPAAPPTVEGLLGLRGVLEMVETAESVEDASARLLAVVASVARALDGLVAARAAEGERLAAILSAAVYDIERLVAEVSASPARRPDAIGARLRDQVARLTGASPALDPERLHQEAVLLATRADVEEELQRLTVHIAAARDLLADHTPVGRKFDFLTQEFNREANTLCSKANAPDISRAGLAMKVVIDQMREQVANIE
jgi:uncharacterized protein (TIGR00255 family)